MVYNKQAFLVGATGSFAIAALHVVIIFVGAPGYRYFGAGSLAPLAQQGSAYPALVTFAIALVFVAWGLYALSGAGSITPLPFLRVALVSIAAIYVLRGLVFVPDFIRLAQRGVYPVRHFVFQRCHCFSGSSMQSASRVFALVRPGRVLPNASLQRTRYARR